MDVLYPYVHRTLIFVIANKNNKDLLKTHYVFETISHYCGK